MKQTKREITSQLLVQLTKKNLGEEELKSTFVKMLLKSISPDVSNVLRICAIPHWFDQHILERVLDIRNSPIDEILRTINKLSFVWATSNEGFAFHEDVRSEILIDWQNNLDNWMSIRKISKKLHSYFLDSVPHNSTNIDEAIYHQFAFSKTKAFNRFLEEFVISLRNWDLTRAEHLLRLVEEKKESLNNDQKCQLTYREAELRFQAGDWENATSLLENLVNKKMPRELRGLVYNKYGLVLDFKKEWEKALQYYEKALKIGERINNYHLVGEAYHNIGIIYRRQEKWEDALRFLEKALNVRKNIEDNWGIAQCYNNLGRVHRKLRNWDKALQYFNLSLDVRKNIGDVGGVAQNYNNIGIILNETGKWETAMETLYKALEIRQRIGDVVGANVTNSNIAAVLENLERYDDAIKILREVVELDKRLNYFDLEFDSYNLNRLLQKVSGTSDQNNSKDEKPYSPS